LKLNFCETHAVQQLLLSSFYLLFATNTCILAKHHLWSWVGNLWWKSRGNRRTEMGVRNGNG